MKLLSIGTSPKTIKSDNAQDAYITGIMYMRPNINICPMSALAACMDPCLNTSGRGAMNMIQEAHQRKTDLFEADPIAFIDQLVNDTIKALRKADKLGKKLAIRLNGTSDLAFENLPGSDGLTLMARFPQVTWYDYTKLPGRKVPSNYHLTVSYSGANPAYAAKVLKTSHNIAVVFDTKKGDSLPAEFNGRQVIDGDLTDLRFLDPVNVVIGLRAKGKARHDTTSGFVVSSNILAIAA